MRPLGDPRDRRLDVSQGACPVDAGATHQASGVAERPGREIGGDVTPAARQGSGASSHAGMFAPERTAMDACLDAWAAWKRSQPQTFIEF